MSQTNLTSLNKFKVGDRVIVYNPNGFRDGKQAKIVEIRVNEVFKYRLLFENGHNLGFNQEEMLPTKNQIVQDIIKDL